MAGDWLCLYCCVAADLPGRFECGASGKTLLDMRAFIAPLPAEHAALAWQVPPSTRRRCE